MKIGKGKEASRCEEWDRRAPCVMRGKERHKVSRWGNKDIRCDEGKEGHLV